MDELRLIKILQMMGLSLLLVILAVKGILTQNAALLGGISLFLVIGIAVHGLIKQEGLSHYQYCFLLIFIVTYLLIWSPLNLMAYLTPTFFLVAMIFVLSTRQEAFILNRLITASLLYVTLTCIYYFVNPDFVPQNALIAFITYSSFLPLLVMPSKLLASEQLFGRMMKLVLLILIVQAVIGIAQGTYGLITSGGFTKAAGDFVEGTMHIRPSPSGAFDGPMYSVNMVLGLILLLAYYQIKQRAPSPFLLLMAVALVLTSVLHNILLGILAIVLALLIVRPPMFARYATKKFMFPILTLALIPLLVVGLLGRNLGSVSLHVSRAMNRQNPKVELMKSIVTRVPHQYPSAPIIGIGPGQFASRACLIGTGIYLGSLPRPFKHHVTPSFNRYVTDFWRAAFRQSRIPGSTMKPVSSWAAVFSEFGAMGLLIISFAAYRLIRATMRNTRKPRDRTLAFFFTAGVLHIFLLGFQEHYWEIPQAIFGACLMLKVLYANIVYGFDDRQGSATEPGVV